MTAAKTTIPNNLIGRRALISMGHPREKVTELLADNRRSPRDPNSAIPAWRHYGESGEIVALTKDGHGEVKASLSLDDGRIIIVFLVHLTLELP